MCNILKISGAHLHATDTVLHGICITDILNPILLFNRKQNRVDKYKYNDFYSDSTSQQYRDSMELWTEISIQWGGP